MANGERFLIKEHAGIATVTDEYGMRIFKHTPSGTEEVARYDADPDALDATAHLLHGLAMRRRKTAAQEGSK